MLPVKASKKGGRHDNGARLWEPISPTSQGGIKDVDLAPTLMAPHQPNTD
jgi:hypothetical protein